jgi:hypothetical protein
MFSFSEAQPIQIDNLTRYFGPAEIISFDENEKTAVIHLKNKEMEYNTFGTLAIPNCPVLSPGDLVLAAGNDINNLFIIGLIKSNQSNLRSERLTLSNGVYAVSNKIGNEEKMQVCSKQGELLFEYDSKTGASRVNIETGDLEIITTKGSINFVSGQDINFSSRQSINMESRLGFKISIGNLLESFRSLFSIDGRKIKISSAELNIISQKTGIQIEEMKFLGKRFSAVLKESKVAAGKIETVVNDVICKAKNIYNSADELLQLKAGRMRSLIKSSLHIKAKDSYLKSEKDFKINGEKIHLG